VSSFQLSGGMSTGSYSDTNQASIETGTRADYDDLKDMKEGEAIISFAMDVIDANIFYSNPGHAKAMRVTRYLALPEPDETLIKHAAKITKLRDALIKPDWTAMKADVAVETPEEIEAIKAGFKLGQDNYEDPIEAQEAIRAISTKATAQAVADAPTQTDAAPISPTASADSAPISAPPADTSKMTGLEKAQQQNQNKPVSFHELNQQQEEQKEPDVQPSETSTQTVEKIKVNLDKNVEDILSKAGDEMKKNLFKSSNNDDPIDAAEDVQKMKLALNLLV